MINSMYMLQEEKIETRAQLDERVNEADAEILMAQTNLTQRESFSISEKAWSYRAMYEAMIRKESSADSEGNGEERDTRKSIYIMADNLSESAKTIQRIIRLTNLISELLDKVDRANLSAGAAYELSFLSKSDQETFLEYMERNKYIPMIDAAKRIRGASEKAPLTLVIIDDVVKNKNALKPKDKADEKNKCVRMFKKLTETDKLFCLDEVIEWTTSCNYTMEEKHALIEGLVNKHFEQAE